MNNDLEFAFGLMGNVISFLVFLAPVPTFYRIWKNKTTGGFQSLPYVVSLFSAMLWIYYAFLKPDATFLFTINSIGCFIQTIYISIYLFYASKKPRLETLMLLTLALVSMSLIVLLTHFLASPPTCADIVGWICLVFSISVFAAPLFIIRQVIKTKSVEYMPFFLSLFLTLSAVMWFFYGLLRKDPNVAIPNVLGFTFGVLQMLLYAIYRKEKHVDEKKPGETQMREDHKSPRGVPNEHAIDVAKPSAMVSLENSPEVLRQINQLAINVNEEETNPNLPKDVAQGSSVPETNVEVVK